MKTKNKKCTITPNHDAPGVHANRKENSYYSGLKAVTVHKGRLHELVDARFYGSGSRCYCCVWISCPPNKKNHSGLWTSGGGNAGGYGYDKPSAALESALSKAGVSLSVPLAGTGENERALMDVCAALGFSKKQVHSIRCHG